jgi:hypothetical protein
MDHQAASRVEPEPLFDSAYAALAFAYRYSTQQYQPTPMARLMRGSIGSGKGLHGLDGAAQAGIIRAMVEALNKPERYVIVGRFATEKVESLEAKAAIVPIASACLGTGVHNRRMVDGLVQKYFGRKVHLGDLSEMTGVHRDTMTSRWASIRNQLRAIEERARDRLDAEMSERGLIA